MIGHIYEHEGKYVRIYWAVERLTVDRKRPDGVLECSDLERYSFSTKAKAMAHLRAERAALGDSLDVVTPAICWDYVERYAGQWIHGDDGEVLQLDDDARPPAAFEGGMPIPRRFRPRRRKVTA